MEQQLCVRAAACRLDLPERWQHPEGGGRIGDVGERGEREDNVSQQDSNGRFHQEDSASRVDTWNFPLLISQ